LPRMWSKFESVPPSSEVLYKTKYRRCVTETLMHTHRLPKLQGCLCRQTSLMLHVRASRVDTVSRTMRDRSMRQTHGLRATEQEFLNGNDLLAIACTLQLWEHGSHLGFEGVFVAAV
jgi:hypothetical protein